MDFYQFLQGVLNSIYNYTSDVLTSNQTPLFISFIIVIFLKYREEIKAWFSDIKSLCKGWIENLAIRRKSWNIKLEKEPEELPKIIPVTNFFAKFDAAQVGVDPTVPEEKVKIIKTEHKGKVLILLKVKTSSPKDAMNALKKGYIEELPVRKEMISVFKDYEGLRRSLEIASLEGLMKKLGMEPSYETEFLKLAQDAFADKRVYIYYNRWTQLNDWLCENKMDLSKLSPSRMQLILLSIVYYSNIVEI